jgi:hypothetical protein
MEHNVTSWFVPNLNLLLMQKKNKCQCNPHPVHIIKQLAVCDIIASNDDPNGGFLKQGHPQIINVNRIFHYKPTIFGVPIYGNPRILISNHQPEPDITTPGTSEHLEQKCEPHTRTHTHGASREHQLLGASQLHMYTSNAWTSERTSWINSWISLLKARPSIVILRALGKWEKILHLRSKGTFPKGSGYHGKATSIATCSINFWNCDEAF